MSKYYKTERLTRKLLVNFILTAKGNSMCSCGSEPETTDSKNN